MAALTVRFCALRGPLWVRWLEEEFLRSHQVFDFDG
jgi:hypothetical protein